MFVLPAFEENMKEENDLVRCINVVFEIYYQDFMSYTLTPVRLLLASGIML